MRRCEDEKMRYRPPLLEEPCAQTLSGKSKTYESTNPKDQRGQQPRSAQGVVLIVVHVLHIARSVARVAGGHSFGPRGDLLQILHRATELLDQRAQPGARDPRGTPQWLGNIGEPQSLAKKMPHQTTGLDQVGLQALAVVPFFRIEPANDITAGGTVRILGVIRGRQSAVHQAAPCEAPLAVAFSDLPAQLPHRQRPTVQKVGATREGSNGTLRCSSLELWATELWLNCINQENII